MTKIDNLKQLKEERSKDRGWGNLNKSKIKIIKQYAGNKILDAGCSTGENIFYLNENGYDAYGCDLLGEPAWKGKYENKFKIADIYNLPYKNNTFETVICFEVFEHLKYPAKALKELFRVATKNIILSVPNCEENNLLFNSGLTFSHFEDRTHINFYTINKLTKFIEEKKYRIKYIKKIDPFMPESIVLYSWYIPQYIAIIIGKIFQRIPLKRKFYTDIVAVISKQGK